ncbi:SMR family transporter [Legionella fallonii]|uniref:Putative 4-amino-4-deoxy-L-arabinose-phosphoundecaprenol flippase subunit ArnE n=1 Tax=Legionella fallonii LLAP-10 TaxID=1212491 RepID=A0A098G5X1_9GAMM|nr:SMR family transporter [Legionella fallonii]CEG57369.1 putative 4-amino-4-deoxy-L-arabinose-phosphoundecaprenol flippase subunit ArnE [Legionella fallonii LLAP-10]
MSMKFIGILLILLSTILEGFGQLLFKYSAILTSRKKYICFIIGVVFLILEFISWTAVLHYIDVNIAYPMSSLSYVFVCLLSFIFLSESLQKQRVLGLIYIVFGTIILGLS